MKIKLQEILDNKNISVYSLSKEIGVTQNNLGKLIKGETTSIKYDILEKLCNILDITPNDIFEIEPQLTLFNYNNNRKEKTLLNHDTLQIIDKLKKENSNTISFTNVDTNEDIIDMEQMQTKFDIEYQLDDNIILIINNILSNTNMSLLPAKIKSEIEAYGQITNIPLMFKFVLVYRSLYIVVVKQMYNKQLLNFLQEIRRVYTKGGYMTISDNKLNELLDESTFLLKDLKFKQED